MFGAEMDAVVGVEAADTANDTEGAVDALAGSG